MSTPSMFFMTAFNMSAALSTSMRFTPGGVAMLTGPQTMVTSAPASRAAAATAKPIFPELRLLMKRTGSMRSRVGPAVSNTRLPASGPVGAMVFATLRRELRRLEHAPGSHFTAGLVALAGSPDMHAARFQRGDIGLRGGIRPHHAVHGRRQRDGRGGGEAQASLTDHPPGR